MQGYLLLREKKVSLTAIVKDALNNSSPVTKLKYGFPSPQIKTL